MDLARDENEAVVSLRHAIQALELVRDPVEALQECVELAISDVVLFHGLES